MLNICLFFLHYPELMPSSIASLPHPVWYATTVFSLLHIYVPNVSTTVLLWYTPCAPMAFFAYPH